MIPSMDPFFLTLDEVLEIHTQQIELYGGSDGVRILLAWNRRWPRRWRLSAGSSCTRRFHPWLPPTSSTSVRTILRGRQQTDGCQRRAITFLLINNGSRILATTSWWIGCSPWFRVRCRKRRLGKRSRCAAAQHQVLLSSSPGIQPGLTVAFGDLRYSRWVTGGLSTCVMNEESKTLLALCSAGKLSDVEHRIMGCPGRVPVPRAAISG